MGVLFEIGEVLLVGVDDLVEELGVGDAAVFLVGFGAKVFSGDGDEAFEIEFIGAGYHVNHLLHFVGLIAHVSEDEKAILFRAQGDGEEGKEEDGEVVH